MYPLLRPILRKILIHYPRLLHQIKNLVLQK